jgi:2-hydroxycyclohexanecarboxyl-CoA dehydrogenase
MNRFDERHAFITGAASGIGAATARRLADEGARVTIADLDEVGAKELAESIGSQAVAVPLDVIDTDTVRDALASSEEAFGPVDVLVNNAGGGERVELFVDSEQPTWDRTLALNLRGAMACTHLVLPGMLTRRRGAIVNVASEAGRAGMFGGSSYAAAKAGVIGFTKAIALEVATRGVRVNAVAPGPIDTPMLQQTAERTDLGARVQKGMIESTAMKRPGRPHEVAAAIAFLASDDASFITGHTLAVSGGIPIS